MKLEPAVFATALAFVVVGCKPDERSIPAATGTVTPIATSAPVVAEKLPESVLATPEAAATPKDELDTLIRKQGSVTFRAWNGKHQGMDHDVDLIFLPGGVVRIVVYSIKAIEFAGVYWVDSDGTVKVKPAQTKLKWPTMWLRSDDKSLLLVSRDRNKRSVTETRDGVTMITDPGESWPFRALAAAHEAQLRRKTSK